MTCPLCQIKTDLDRLGEEDEQNRAIAKLLVSPQYDRFIEAESKAGRTISVIAAKKWTHPAYSGWNYLVTVEHKVLGLRDNALYKSINGECKYDIARERKLYKRLLMETVCGMRFLNAVRQWGARCGDAFELTDRGLLFEESKGEMTVVEYNSIFQCERQELAWHFIF